jgi:hypothetical protein
MTIQYGGGINMYSVCGFEVASAKYSIGCKPVLFSFSPDIDRACNDGEQKVILIYPKS